MLTKFYIKTFSRFRSCKNLQIWWKEKKINSFRRSIVYISYFILNNLLFFFISLGILFYFFDFFLYNYDVVAIAENLIYAKIIVWIINKNKNKLYSLFNGFGLLFFLMVRLKI